MTLLSQRVLDKFNLFFGWVNRPTETGHPLDETRWFDFICQTVDDGNVIDAGMFEDILQDEEYFEKGNALNKHLAQKVAAKYERDCRFLQYHRWKLKM